MSTPTLFLDRDGVINIDHGYVYKREEFVFVDGIFDLVRQARQCGCKVVIITNQAGIGRGFYTEDDFHQLCDWMLNEFSLAGAPIDRIYFSPYHPTAAIGEYLRDDFSRKPHPGMILNAQKDLDIDLGRSVLVGDKESDMQAGIAAGVGTNLLFSSEQPASQACVGYLRIKALREAIPYVKPDRQAEPIR